MKKLNYLNTETEQHCGGSSYLEHGAHKLWNSLCCLDGSFHQSLPSPGIPDFVVTRQWVKQVTQQLTWSTCCDWRRLQLFWWSWRTQDILPGMKKKSDIFAYSMHNLITHHLTLGRPCNHSRGQQTGYSYLCWWPQRKLIMSWTESHLFHSKTIAGVTGKWIITIFFQ